MDRSLPTTVTDHCVQSAVMAPLKWPSPVSMHARHYRNSFGLGSLLFHLCLVYIVFTELGRMFIHLHWCDSKFQKWSLIPARKVHTGESGQKQLAFVHRCLGFCYWCLVLCASISSATISSLCSPTPTPGLNICTSGSATSCQECLLIHPSCAWCAQDVRLLNTVLIIKSQPRHSEC